MYLARYGRDMQMVPAIIKWMDVVVYCSILGFTASRLFRMLEIDFRK